MQFDARSLLTLYKVNLESYFRLCGLLWENARRQAGAIPDAFERTAEFENVLTSVFRAHDGKTIALVAGDLPWHVLQLQTIAVRRLAESAIGNQTAFATAVQESLSMWQKDSVTALKETADTMPVSTTLRTLLRAR